MGLQEHCKKKRTAGEAQIASLKKSLKFLIMSYLFSSGIRGIVLLIVVFFYADCPATDLISAEAATGLVYNKILPKKFSFPPKLHWKN